MGGASAWGDGEWRAPCAPPQTRCLVPCCLASLCLPSDLLPCCAILLPTVQHQHYVSTTSIVELILTGNVPEMRVLSASIFLRGAALIQYGSVPARGARALTRRAA